MRRRAAAVVALSLALATAAVGVALAVGAGAADEPSHPAPSASATEAVSADDRCYVEAMIYYRVEESELARLLAAKDGIDAGALGFASGIAARDADELEELRERYLSWADARPAEPPADGPCAGHGADHAQMPGMPSWSTLQGFVDARHPDAERRFAEILRAQNAGMIALVTRILDGDPHPAVRASAEKVRRHAAADQQTLQAMLDSPP